MKYLVILFWNSWAWWKQIYLKDQNTKPSYTLLRYVLQFLKFIEIIDADLGDADISDTNTDGAADGTTSAVSAENEEDEDIDLSTFLSDSDSFED